jgi:hypothetical protein
MTRIFYLLPSFLLFLTTLSANAVYTEFGLSQSYKKTSFSEQNYVESEMLSGSVSFFIWERVALEFSYTQGIAVRKEQETGQPIRTITQHSSVYGSDLILGFSDRRSTFQPFVKGGVAYIQKRQTTQDDGTPAFETTPSPGYVPSYGVGMKIKLTENFGLTTSLDIWKDSSTSSNDMASRTGITWMF